MCQENQETGDNMDDCGAYYDSNLGKCEAASRFDARKMCNDLHNQGLTGPWWCDMVLGRQGYNQ